MSAGILDGFQTIIPTAAAVLSEKRQILRLTQQEVADRAKITLRQYQRLESGERIVHTKPRSSKTLWFVIPFDQSSPREKENS